MEFIRYGNLKSQWHDTEGVWEYIHTPPVAYGIYAFPKGYVEPFLLGGIGSGSVENGRMKYYRDDSGNKVYMSAPEFIIFVREEYKGKDILKYQIDENYYISSNDIIEYNINLYEYNDDGKNPIYVMNKPTRFNYNGLIWHHLYKEKNDKYAPYYLKRIGKWVLTDIKTYEKCLKRATAEYKHYASIWRANSGITKVTNIMGFPKTFDKDRFEVYIEKIK